ncbi:MAG: aminopeptidase P family protein, partial [Gammaproteobacteria bacterium]|nr:aminopeptidase P family protein [Gammaproteobacteria bacterium]
MTIGIGGSTAEQELARLDDMTKGIKPIAEAEFKARIEAARRLMDESALDAVYLNAGTNLYYFTGTRWGASERLVGAVLTANGELEYIAPHFEIDTLLGFMHIKGAVNGWQEHESPYQLFAAVLARLGVSKGRIGLDESAPFFITDGLVQANPLQTFVSAKPVTAGCRMCKSAAELALLQRAKDMTIEVHK